MASKQKKITLRIQRGNFQKAILKNSTLNTTPQLQYYKLLKVLKANKMVRLRFVVLAVHLFAVAAG